MTTLDLEVTSPVDSLKVPDSARICTPLGGREVMETRIAYFAADDQGLWQKRKKIEVRTSPVLI